MIKERFRFFSSPRKVKKKKMGENSERIVAIDIFRGITMFLMIFVNDLWTLHHIPNWLKHAAPGEDGLGFSDLIFPAFLFIAGASIPIALDKKPSGRIVSINKLKYIGSRTFALVVMGFFMVNLEYLHPSLNRFEKDIFKIAVITSFFLIWNKYPSKYKSFFYPISLQGIGVLLLVFVAIYYKGGTTSHPRWLEPHWWGILGLIGWSYMLVSFFYLITKGSFRTLTLLTIAAFALNIQEFQPWFGKKGFRIIISASHYTMVFSGLLVTLLYQRMKEITSPAITGRGKKRDIRFLYPTTLILIGAAFMLYGLTTRPLWGISKISATPSWTGISIAISLILYSLIFLITSVYQSTKWALPFLSAGRNALTTYLIPVIFYPLFIGYIKKIPYTFTGSYPGLVKSALFAFLIIGLTTLLEKIQIKLKV